MSQGEQSHHPITLSINSKMRHVLVETDMNSLHMLTRYVVTMYNMKLPMIKWIDAGSLPSKTILLLEGAGKVVLLVNM